MSNAKAEVCNALGCSRKTRNKHGFCFQHSDMAINPTISTLTDQQLSEVGATVPAGRNYDARRDRVIADAAVLEAISRTPSAEMARRLQKCIDTLLIYASHNRRGPQAAQDALVDIASVPRSKHHE